MVACGPDGTEIPDRAITHALRLTVGDVFPAGAANRKESGMSYVVTQVVDPVCGMTINRENAVAVTYQGTTYYFCEDVCAQIFRDEPERWVEKFEHDPMPHAH